MIMLQLLQEAETLLKLSLIHSVWRVTVGPARYENTVGALADLTQKIPASTGVLSTLRPPAKPYLHTDGLRP